MRSNRFVLPLFAAGLMALPLSSCDTVKSGSSGTLAFSYDADDDFIATSFNTPIAVGMKADVKVLVGTTNSRAATVQSASTSPSSIIQVASTSSTGLTLGANKAGAATLSVSAAEGKDTIEVVASDLAVVELKYPGPMLSTVSPPIAIPQGGTGVFQMSMKDANGRGLIGYGTPPVTMEPATSASVVSSKDVAHANITFTALGDVKLKPMGGSELTITVIAKVDVKTVDLTVWGSATSVDIGKDALFVLGATATSGTTVAGLNGLAAVTSKTPDICTITENRALGDGAYVVRGLKAGTCTVDATMDTLTSSASIEVK